MSDAVIATEELSKWFGEVVALNSVNVRIGPGVTGLLGPNGAGKSTFIKLVLGLYAPSRGRIAVFGAPPRGNPDVLRRIGYCPETDRFYENATGYEQVYWMNRLWGMRPRRARTTAEAVLERLGMTARMHDPIPTYSKGMRQRIKLAQALATEPDLLFLDEPMTGLDPRAREEMFALIRHLGDEGLAVIVSSHILHEVERATDYIVMLYHGLLLAQGSVREIRDLIDEHPHAIRVSTPDPGAVAAHFAQDAAVAALEREPTSLVLRTRDPHGTYTRLTALAAAGAISVDGLNAADDNLQSVFEYLTR